jgi:aminoglycoside phosphotransferase (APT) family kinase protein
MLRGVDQLRALDPPAVADVSGSLVNVLARLHRLDPAAVGLGDLGRPEGYMVRQVWRWSSQLEGEHVRDVPGFVDLGRRLAASVPVSGPAAVVHGDYRLDNVVVSTDDHTVRGVLDWEMATLGDPLADLASTVLWWDGLRGMDSPVAAVPGDVPGWPDGGALLDRYATATGAHLEGLPWYMAFAFFKIAVILSRSTTGHRPA